MLDINCTDPLGRTALSIAIINENPELMEILLEAGIQVLVFVGGGNIFFTIFRGRTYDFVLIFEQN